MSKKEKLLKKALETPENMRFDELESLMRNYGFVQTRTRGSHVMFKHEESGERMNIQPDKSDKSKAKIYQVKQFIEIIKRLELMED